MPLSPVRDLSSRLDVGGQLFQGLPDSANIRLDPPSGLAAAAMPGVQHEVDTLGYRGIVEDRRFLAPQPLNTWIQKSIRRWISSGQGKLALQVSWCVGRRWSARATVPASRHSNPAITNSDGVNRRGSTNMTVNGVTPVAIAPVVGEWL